MRGPYRVIARVTPMREVLGKRPTPTRVVAARRQPPDDRPGGVGPRGIPAHVFIEQDEDTYTPAAAEKLARATLRAARFCSRTRPMMLAAALLPDPTRRFWWLSRDGDPAALALYRRHYSAHHYRDGRRPRLFVGPGEKLVLLSFDQLALFIWRRFRSMDEQEGVNCAVFRNESSERSSEMILEAMAIAWARWPGERLYTYVDARKIRSTNPGFCFLAAGWQQCGRTKDRDLVVLEVRP